MFLTATLAYPFIILLYNNLQVQIQPLHDCSSATLTSVFWLVVPTLRIQGDDDGDMLKGLGVVFPFLLRYHDRLGDLL